MLENAQFALISQRGIQSGSGVQLDAIGKLVGQPRDGATDSVYQQYLAARVLANRSGGTPEELIAVANAVLGLAAGHIWIRSQNDASLILEVRDSPVTTTSGQVLQQMVCAATDGGVRVFIVYSRETLANTFRLDLGPGLDQGHLAAGVDGALTGAF